MFAVVESAETDAPTLTFTAAIVPAIGLTMVACARFSSATVTWDAAATTAVSKATSCFAV